MQLGIHNLSRQFRGAYRGLCGLLCFVVLISTSPASAKDYMSNAAFKGLVLAIMNVNMAMRAAAENPMDEPRRQNVRTAISMLPAAIIALAGEFKSGTFVNSDLPMVQSMLGGFIDQSAPEHYRDFLKSPSAANIPQVGKNFPGNINAKPPSGSGNGNSDRLFFDDGAAKAGSASSGNDSPKALRSDLVDLQTDPNSIYTPTIKAPVAAAGANDPQLIFDDNAKKSDVASSGTGAKVSLDNVPSFIKGAAVGIYENAYSSPENLASAPSAASSADFLSQATRDLATLEVSDKSNSKKLGTLDSENEFFGKKAKEKKKAERGDKQEVQRYQIETNPKYWRVLPVMSASEMFSNAAKAEGGGDIAAQILIGLAMIIAAMAPIMVAKTQAQADIKITKMNNQAQIKQTTIAADTTKYSTDTQKSVYEAQLATTEKVAEDQQKGVTDRLSMQLAELKAAREEANDLEKQKRSYAEKLDQERIDLTKQEAQQTEKLADEQYKAQLAAAGLSEGFSKTQNSGANLVASAPNGNPYGPQALGVQQGPGGQRAAAANNGGPLNGGMGSAANVGLASANAKSQSQSARAMGGLGGLGGAGGQTLRGVTERLVAAGVNDPTGSHPANGNGSGGGGSAQSGQQNLFGNLGTAGSAPSQLSMLGVVRAIGAPNATLNVAASNALSKVLEGQVLVRGSSKVAKVKPAKKPDDLTTYQNLMTTNTKNGFADYYSRETTQRGNVGAVPHVIPGVMPAATGSSHKSGAYGVKESSGGEEDLGGVIRAYRGTRSAD